MVLVFIFRNDLSCVSQSFILPAEDVNKEADALASAYRSAVFNYGKSKLLKRYLKSQPTTETEKIPAESCFVAVCYEGQYSALKF